MDKALDIEIGKKLKTLRDRKGYSTREVAERIGVSNGYITQIEKGKIPSLTVLNNLCNLYNTDIPTLFSSQSANVPEDLQKLGVEWIMFSEEMKKKNLTPEDIKRYIEVVKAFKDL